MTSIKESPNTLDSEYFECDDSGIETEEISSEIIVEPFDPTLIRVTTQPSTVDLLLSRIRHGELDLAPSFQRKGGIWNDAAQSRLIESMLIRIPLPAFYMDATEDEKWLVVDGLQRLTTFRRFAIDETLRLTGLEFLSKLHGKTYKEIPRNYQRRILETQITVYVIETGTPPEVKFNIFKRINTGGLALSAQEIRHALNQGPVTDYLQSLAQSQVFKRATNDSIRPDRMADRECVLRFLAFAITSFNEYKAKDLDSFLNDAMKEINKMSQQRRDELQSRFLRAMDASYNLFGKEGFRKYSNNRTMPINKPLFEAWSVNLDKLNNQDLQLLIERKETLNTKLKSLLDSYDFDRAISLGTGDAQKVKLRFSRIEQLIREVWHDPITASSEL